MPGLFLFDVSTMRQHESIQLPIPAHRFDARAPLVIALAVVFLIAKFLLDGRLWWCECGRPFIYSGEINSQHNSQHIVDPYSISHILHGVIFFFAIMPFARHVSLLWRLTIATIIEIGWELLENSPVIIDRYRAATISLGYEGDTIANSLSDVAMAMIGFLIAWRIGWKWSVAFFLASELFMLWWIRDNLFLNVLMLIHPIDAVRHWQAASAALF